MPITERTSAGQTWLIVEAPTSRGSRVNIRFEDALGFNEITASYQGGAANGKPVLSPVLCDNMLPELERIDAERTELLRGQFVYLDEDRYPLDGYEGTRLAALEMISTLAQARPVFPSVKLGSPLLLVMPGIFPTNRFVLGKQVIGWSDIDNR